jgi:hypothetical protein
MKVWFYSSTMRFWQFKFEKRPKFKMKSRILFLISYLTKSGCLFSSLSTSILSAKRLVGFGLITTSSKFSLKVMVCAAAAALIAFRVVGLAELPFDIESQLFALGLIFPPALLNILQLFDELLKSLVSSTPPPTLAPLFNEQFVVVVNEVFDRHKQLESSFDASPQLCPGLHSLQ